jgi:hypothetical protein
MPTGFLFLVIFVIILAASSIVDVPVRVDGLASIGQSVRIQSSTDKDAVVVLDTVRPREFVCQKCGHINRI